MIQCLSIYTYTQNKYHTEIYRPLNASSCRRIPMFRQKSVTKSTYSSIFSMVTSYKTKYKGYNSSIFSIVTSYKTKYKRYISSIFSIETSYKTKYKCYISSIFSIVTSYKTKYKGNISLCTWTCEINHIREQKIEIKFMYKHNFRMWQLNKYILPHFLRQVSNHTINIHKP